MNIQTPKFIISRQKAAEILEVSTRTIDRYIRRGKLGARKKGGNILLAEEELNNIKISRFQNMHGASPEVSGRAHRFVDSVSAREGGKIFDVETGEIEEQMEKAIARESASSSVAQSIAQSVARKSEREKVFEELYDLSRREIREYHNKLEAANYRLGQLETQSKYSVPLLEFHEKENLLQEQETLIQGKMKRQEEALRMMEQETKGERLNKNIYIGLLIGLLSLQVLFWLLVQS